MWLQVAFWTELAGVSINRLQSPRSQRCMQWNGQGLAFAGRQCSSHFAMAASRGYNFEPKSHQGRGDVAAGQLSKPQ